MSWPAAIELWYSKKGVVGVQNQTDVIQELRDTFLICLMEDVFFLSAYPSPPLRFRRYKNLLLVAVDHLGKEPSDPIWATVKKRIQSDKTYTSGLIGMVRASLISLDVTDVVV